MIIHDLKTDPEAFRASCDGVKPWEIRFDDRGFKVGDLVVLLETKHSGEEMRRGFPLEYTGRRLTRRIDYILPVGSYVLYDGWVVMTVSPALEAPK